MICNTIEHAALQFWHAAKFIRIAPDRNHATAKGVLIQLFEHPHPSISKRAKQAIRETINVDRHRQN